MSVTRPSLVLRRGIFVTMDAQRREIADGAVFARDGVIEAVGSTAQLPQSADEIIDARGQIVIPKVLREARNWHAGTSFVVEEVPQGLLLKAVNTFTPSTLKATSAGPRS